MKPYLLALALLAVATLSSKAQILYTLTDSQDNLDFTYESSSFITAHEGPVLATTANTSFNNLTFDPDVYIPYGSGLPFFADLLGVDNDSGQSFGFSFALGSFGTLGTFSSPVADVDSPFGPATLTVSEVPEPSTCALAFVGLVALAFVARRRAKA